jgi:hypothetical protein
MEWFPLIEQKGEEWAMWGDSCRAVLADVMARQDWLSFPRGGSLGIPPHFAGWRLAGTLALPLRQELTLIDLPMETWKNPSGPNIECPGRKADEKGTIALQGFYSTRSVRRRRYDGSRSERSPFGLVIRVCLGLRFD